MFEALLSPEDAILSDELNHASIIDGVRLCKAKKFKYKNKDMAGMICGLPEVNGKTINYKLFQVDCENHVLKGISGQVSINT